MCLRLLLPRSLPCDSPPARASCVIASWQRTDRIIVHLFCARVRDDQEACRALRLQLMRFFVIAIRQQTDRITRKLRVPAFVVTKKPCASTRTRAAFVILPSSGPLVSTCGFYMSAVVVTKKLAMRFASRSPVLSFCTQAAGRAYHHASFVSAFVVTKKACRALRLQLMQFFVIATRQQTDRITRKLRVPAFVATKKPCAAPRARAAFVFLLSNGPLVSPCSFICLHLS